MKLDHPETFHDLLRTQIKRWEERSGAPVENVARAGISKTIEDSRFSDFTISSTLHRQLRDRLSPFFFKEWIVEAGSLSADRDLGYPHTRLIDVLPVLRDSISVARIPASDLGVDQRLFAGSQIGYCHASTISKLGAVGLHIKEDPKEFPVDSYVGCHFGFQGERCERTLAAATLGGLGIYQSLSFHQWQEPSIVIAGESISDFCLYQGMSRLRERVIWLPPSVTQDLLAQEEKISTQSMRFLIAMRSATAYSHTHPDSIAMTSISLDLPVMGALAEKASRSAIISNTPWSITAPASLLQFSPLRIYEQHNASIPSLVQVSEDRVIDLFEPRRPKSLKHFSPHKVRWVTELRFQGVALTRHPMLGEWMMGSSSNTTKDIRVSSAGLAFMSVNAMLLGGSDVENASVRPTIRLPSVTQIFEVASASGDLVCSTSDKGFYSSVAVEKFGGLEKAAQFLRSSAGQKFIAAYKAGGKENTVGIYLRDDGRLYLDFDAFSTLVGNSEEATRTLDDFSERGSFTGVLFSSAASAGEAHGSL